ncbi:MAG: GNAT family N-acetyltransferase [Bacillota bacterium]
MPALGPVTLSGRFVRLEPLRRTHLDALLQVASDDRIWAWLPRKLQSAEAMSQFIAEAMAAEERQAEYAFAVVLRDSGRVVGSTRYCDIASFARGLEIGWTWYAPEVWQTRVNPESKYLLLQHAFETWKAIRVYFKTDERNQRSRAAIAKLGAQFEGILRNHRIRQDGTYRGSAVYSIIESEWPGVKEALLSRLASYGDVAAGE